MENKINTMVTIGQNFIEINAFVNKNGRNICIFNNSWNEKENLNSISSKDIIANSLNEIRDRIQSDIKFVDLIIDDFSFTSNKFDVLTKIVEETPDYIKYPTVLTEEHYEKMKNSAISKLKNNEKHFQLCSLIPFRFIVDKMSYSKFPFGIRANNVKCVFSVRYLSYIMYRKILEMFSKTDVKFNNIIFKSQLSIYKNESVNNKLTFTFDVQETNSYLMTSLNGIVIATDRLRFSYNDLIKKISKDFDINNELAQNIIECYGNVNVDEVRKKEILFLNQNKNFHINQENIEAKVKSFIKTLVVDINEIIKDKTSDYKVDHQVNLVGKIQNIQNLGLYCAKYIYSENQEILVNKKQNYSFFNWAYEDQRNLVEFLKVVSNKTTNDNVNVEQLISSQSIKKQHAFSKSPKKRFAQSEIPLLA